MAARVITIAQQKGGAGKSTLAAHLAVAWQAAGRRVVLVDIDPQGTLARWFAERAAAPLDEAGAALAAVGFSAVAGWRAGGEIDRLSRDHDLVVVDSPPHAQSDAGTAIRAAHLVVTPVQPSPLDLWATRPIIALALAERRPLLLVLNRVAARSPTAAAMAAEAATLGAELAAARLGNRGSLAAAMARGRTVTETAPGTIASREVAKLAREVLSRVEG